MTIYNAVAMAGDDLRWDDVAAGCTRTGGVAARAILARLAEQPKER